MASARKRGKVWMGLYRDAQRVSEVGGFAPV